MIRLNRRSFDKVGFKALANLANSMQNREYKFLRQSYDRACGLGHNDPVKKWILDIDFHPSENIMKTITHRISNIEPKGNKILDIIPSKAGLHIITTAFNLAEFKEEFTTIDVHKDNPTNLYIP